MESHNSNGDHNELHISDDDDEDIEEISAAEALTALTAAWTGEKASPDLLPPKAHIVDLLLHQVSNFRVNLFLLFMLSKFIVL